MEPTNKPEKTGIFQSATDASAEMRFCERRLDETADVPGLRAHYLARWLEARDAYRNLTTIK